ncbi:MAG: hypothetical protein ACOXZ4_04400 [Sphaerochaetaceae bacterium]
MPNPLSLQVHPSDQQIRNRYIQEASLPVPKRTYSDTRGKEEIFVRSYSHNGDVRIFTNAKDTP